MDKNLKGELVIMDTVEIKPNYAALGRKYGMDPRTVKKYHNGYEGRPKTRNKGSKLDQYRTEIADKLSIRRLTVQGVYRFVIKKYGIERIGSYSNFNRYVKNNKLRPKAKGEGHPRYEKGPGEQGQVDWKEDITMANKFGEIFTINVLHLTLKFSRYSYLEISVQKRFDDVARGLINGFRKFGGVPKELLFDNMSTVANVQAKPKKPTEAIRRMAKDFGFNIRFCGTRKPETKGTVEAKNKTVDWIRAYEGEFETIEELMEIMETINKDMNIDINQETGMSPAALFYKEKEYLKPMPDKSFTDTYLSPNKYKVYSDSLIHYGSSRYSVDPKLIGEEVTVDVLDNKLYIYYNGKLAAFHPLSEKKNNYNEEHYKKLMNGKVKKEDMDSIASENLEIMDKLLEYRKASVSETAAIKSENALIAYINQSEYGRWVITRYSCLKPADRLVFLKGMNEVLPYVANREAFISRIKFSMKECLCRNLDFDCWVNDFMAAGRDECVLTDAGYEIIKNKYSAEIDTLINKISQQYGQGQCEADETCQEHTGMKGTDSSFMLPGSDELPLI